MLGVIAVSIPLALTLLLSDRAVQAYAVRKATEMLSDKLEVPVSIGSVEYRIPATIDLNDVYISDRNLDTLAYIGSFYTSIRILPLFEKKIVVKGIEVDRALFNIAIDSVGQSNLQFIIDAFATKDTTPQTFDFVVKAGNIRFSDCAVHIDNTGKPHQEGRLDPNHIYLHDINTSIDVKHAAQDSVYVSMESFSMKEQSGLEITDMHVNGWLGNSGASINQLRLSMPETYVDIEALTLTIDSLPQLYDIKQLTENGKVKLVMNESYISGKDLACIDPKLGKLRHKLIIATDIDYSYHSINLNNLSASYGPNVTITANATISDPMTPDQTFIFADVSDVQIEPDDVANLIYELSDHKTNIRQTLEKFGHSSFTGNITGYYSDLVAYGTLKTDAGIINTDMMLSYEPKKETFWFKGDISTPLFDIGRFAKGTMLESISADLTVDGGRKTSKGKLNGNIKGSINSLVYNGYTFDDIDIDGIYNSEEASAKIEYYDNNGNGDISLDAHIDYQNETKLIDLQLYLDSINPYGLHLIDKFENLDASLMVGSHIEVTGNDLIHGWLAIDSIKIKNSTDTYLLNELLVTCDIKGHNSCIDIKSHLLNGHLDGEMTPSLIGNNLKYIIAQQLKNYAPLQTSKKACGNNFDFKLKIAPITPISDVMQLSFSIDDTTYIYGDFNDHKDNFSLNMTSNGIELEKMSADSLTLSLSTHQKKLELSSQTLLHTQKDTITIKVGAGLLNNHISTELCLRNRGQVKYHGDVEASVDFLKPEIKGTNLNIACHVKESHLQAGPSTWDIAESDITYDERTLKVNNFDITSENQFIRIDGQASKDPEKDKELALELKNFDISYIFKLLPKQDPSFVGIVSGDVHVAELFGKPRLDANLSAKGFGLNNSPMGDVDAHAKFNHDNHQIDIYGTVNNGIVGDTSYVSGFISPVRNEMLLDINFTDLNLGLLKRYLSVFADDMDATASGELHVGGKLNAIDLWGAAYVHDAFISVDFLKTKYTFADSVRLEKDKIILDHITLTDPHGNKGMLNGLLTHRHFLDFRYNIDISLSNMQVLNTTEEDMPEFYGTIFASGTTYISGADGYTNILVSARPEKNSYFALPLETTNNASDNQFIKFINKKDININTVRRLRKKRIINAPTAKLNVDISLEATPDVECQIIINSHTGDIIKARGNGNVKVNIDNNSNIKLYGRYTITEGDYNFSLEAAIRKKFEVAPGSYIAFDGEPMNGLLNIDAMYQTTASLTDLIEESMLADVKNRMQKVNCYAYIRGNLQEPKVSFGIELPNADDEIQRRVRATINTEDLMSQQIVCLLLFSKFYNPQVTNQSFSGTSMAASFATATISSQLNYWMSQISDAVNLGLNYQEDNSNASNDRSFAVNISTNFLDNRLLINGNLGYRTQYGSNDFIGDFDVEYKLNRSGRLRLKAYNQTNDKLYSTALYTQGVGIMYKETFDTWKNLGQSYKELFRKKTPEEKAEQEKKKEIEKKQAEERRAAKKALKEDRKRRHREYVEQQKALKEAAKASKNKEG